jgi:RNA polymerase sigma-70 factor, ECF subfamily
VEPLTGSAHRTVPGLGTDEALIRMIFAEHGRAMLAYATRLTGDRASGEDAVQEALIRAWRNADTLLNGKGSVRGWLLTVVRNIITDGVRARNARPKEVAESATTGPVHHDHADTLIDSMLMVAALDKLPQVHRSVIVEIYVHGHSLKRTAEILGIPLGTVKSRSHNGLRALHEIIGERTDAAQAAPARCQVNVR